jgi:polysaccharide export outer membrane protein
MKLYRLLLPVATVLLCVSCRTTEELAYFKDASRDSVVTFDAQFSKGIQSNDLLSIYVESETPESTKQYNQETNKIAVEDGVVINPGTGASAVSGYLVSAEGSIIFPVLGKLYVVGMTHDSLAHYIEHRLMQEGHIKDPRVTVKLMNFKVSVLGEVAKPGQLVVDGERLTIFEALSMSGDLTIYGQRKNVTVVREENGNRVIGNIDLTSKNVFNSPYYYLHQNDVVFVEPNLKRKRTAERDPMTLSYIASIVSILSVSASIYYYIILSKRN